jgi:hypothetical protein
MRISCVQVYRITAHFDIAAFSAHAARQLVLDLRDFLAAPLDSRGLPAALLRDFLKSPPADIERGFLARQ